MFKKKKKFEAKSEGKKKKLQGLKCNFKKRRCN